MTASSLSTDTGNERHVMKTAIPSVLVAFCAACVGCGVLQRQARMAFLEPPPSSAPVEDRAAWPEYRIVCGTEALLFRSPPSLRHPPRIRETIPPDGVGSIITMYYQGFDAELGNGLFPGFDIEICLLSTEYSDLLRNDPAGYGEIGRAHV